MNITITEFIEAAAHNKIIQLVVLAIVCDTVFGVLRAIKEKKFNSCAGIDGAIRKVGMLISLVFMLAIDVLIKINLIGFIPEQARTYLGLDTVGVAEFFALLYIAYEVVSIFKNMALCGLPVKKVCRHCLTMQSRRAYPLQTLICSWAFYGKNCRDTQQ